MNEHESYVSLETAELLKQAGFKWWTDQYYGSKTYLKGTDKEVHPDAYSLGEMDWRIVNELIWCGHKNDDSLSYSAPTLAVAQRWLRDEKKVIISMLYQVDEGWIVLARSYAYGLVFDKKVSTNHSYEEALEAGIKDCLRNLVSKRK